MSLSPLPPPHFPPSLSPNLFLPLCLCLASPFSRYSNHICVLKKQTTTTTKLSLCWSNFSYFDKYTTGRHSKHGKHVSRATSTHHGPEKSLFGCRKLWRSHSSAAAEYTAGPSNEHCQLHCQDILEPSQNRVIRTIKMTSPSQNTIQKKRMKTLGKAWLG